MFVKTHIGDFTRGFDRFLLTVLATYILPTAILHLAQRDGEARCDPDILKFYEMSSFTYEVEFKMHEMKNKTSMSLNTFAFLAEFPNSDGHDWDFLDSSPLAFVLHSMRRLLFHR